MDSAAGAAQARDDDKEAVSDVQYSPGLDEPELLLRTPARARRFARRAASVAVPARRPAVGITEGVPQVSVNVRDGLYRRTLALADALAAFLALTLVVVWDAGAKLDPWVLLAGPVAVLVSKVGGLYERDELVLKKTTLDEAPALPQISGMFALIVFLGQNVFVHKFMSPPIVAELWLATFAALFVGRVAARSVAARVTRPERCLVLGDADAISTIRDKLGSAGVNAEVVASVRLDRFSPRVNADRFLSLVCDNDVHRLI